MNIYYVSGTKFNEKTTDDDAKTTEYNRYIYTFLNI